MPTLFVIKSTKSKMERSNILTSDRIPKDRALGIPKMKIISPPIHAIFLRLSGLSPMAIATTISNIEIEEVTVANSKRIKKIVKNMPQVAIAQKQQVR
ncbi:hypothetical protein LSPH24S_07466 [Lysinibacillus sphaericus]